jgi:DNA-binding NarL/FixJ family response regulator
MRLVLADDFVLFREGLARLVTEAGFQVVGHAGDVPGLIDAVASREPDAAVIDIRMPPTHTTEGLDAAARIRSCHPRVGVVLFSHHVEVHHALQLLDGGEGGIGYLLKDRVEDLSRFADALRRVGRGERVIDREVVAMLLDRTRRQGRLDGLTERERVVLRLLAEGRSNHGIRIELGVTDRTVETHVRSILMKLEVPDAESDHRRVLAALSYLRGRSASDLSTGTDDRERVPMT